MAIFSITKEKISAPPTTLNAYEIENQYNHLDSLIEFILDEKGPLSDAMSKIPDESGFFFALDNFSKARVGTKDELNFAGLVLEASFNLKKSLTKWSNYKNFNIDDSDIQKVRREFLKPLRHLIGIDGSIYYERHPELAPLFARLGGLESELRDSLNQSLKSSLYKNAIQFDGHDLINDHYVIAVRADSYQGPMGQIISRSTTGLTLYVEPPVVRERVNERFLLLSKIEEVLQRIFTELSMALRNNFGPLILSRELIFSLDEYMAKASYTLNKRLIRPEITDDFVVDLFDFFHPLIKNPVKNSISLKNEHTGLVISGPNTGGKTVALKSIALCHLFMHKGLFLPCRRATLSIVPNIIFLGNDRQSLTDGLSSFAGEVKNLFDLYNQLNDEKTLIFVDEIFNSTSSDEASALAMSFINHFIHKFKAKFFISTHHQLLKTLAFKRPDFISAHVGHNLEERKPTYKLFTGSPGDSLAFEIIRNFHNYAPLSEKIADLAAQMMESHAINYQILLNELTEKNTILESKINEQEKTNQKLKEREHSFELYIKQEKERLLTLYEKSLKNVLEKAESILERTKRGEISSRNRLLDHGASLKQEIAKSKPTNEIAKDSFFTDFSQLKVGQVYRHTALGKNVSIKSINEKKSEILATSGNMTFKVKLSELAPLNPSQVPQSVKITFQRESTPSFEIDCRGLRLEEFQNRVQTEIAHLIAGEVPYLLVIHGHGDGVLKRWLRDFLKNNPLFTYTVPDGNDGCTEIRLV